TLLLQKAFSAPFWRSFFFVWVIVGSMWYLGKGPGFTAVILSTLAVDYYFTPPAGEFSQDLRNLPFVVVFFIFALVSGWISSRLKERERALSQARDELETRVQERTKELEKSNTLLLTEIEERRRAEKVLREQTELLHLTHDSIFVRDGAGIITYWNRGAEELYGWKNEEAIGKTAHELLGTVFPEPLEKIMSRLIVNGRWDGELVHTRRDGSQVIVSSRWAVQRGDDGQPVAILETNNDITEQKRAEDDIRKLNEELEMRVIKRTNELGEVNKELEAFAYSVSHDLRAPLRHLAGYAELLQKSASSNLDEKSTRYVAMILESAKRMGDLIDDLLAFSRTSRAEIKKSRVSLEELVDEVLGDVKR
ncbi:MAG: PAS domain S-box protein, partial [Candidatus Dadabacteria bacterium]|nr:PAS domain S-box protein [Candidatus Dadabacteria bacterium]